MKHLNAMLRMPALAAAVALSPSAATGGVYFIHSSVGSLEEGSAVSYRDRQFIAGRTAFASIWTLLGKGVEEGSEIYFGPGNYGNVTISTPGVKLLGANAYCDAWSGQRNAGESNVTGVWKINAGGVTVNGFRFTAGGCVRNDAASRGSGELDGFTFVYNKAEATTLQRGEASAILYLGDAWRPSATDPGKREPAAWGAVNRYKDVTIAHNAFMGIDADDQPHAVSVAGSYGVTRVVDNRFDKGGTSVSLFNTEGIVDVSHNCFTDVGAGQRKAGSATGEFCLRLYYISCRDGVEGSVCHNTFDNCQGQSSMYSLIRFYSGDSNEAACNPVNCSLKINHNLFRNKTVYRQSDGYNYVFYANNTITTTASVDWRWNRYDNSEMCFGWVRPQWASTAGRYFGGSSEVFEHSTGDATGTEVDFYGKKDADGSVLFGRETPTGGAGGLKGWTYGTKSVAGRVCTTVTQSMDIDDATGDIYTIQESSKTSKFGKAVSDQVPAIRDGSDKFLFMTRVAKTSSGYSESHMYLSYGGHGSNMAVTRRDGKLYVLTGGVGTKTSTTPTKICIFPWSEGAAIDLRQTVSNGVEIKHFGNEYSHRMPYPSVDNDNRLFVERSRENSGDYFTIYDLDEVMDDPSGARPLKQVFVPAGAKKISGSSRAFLNTADNGFKTWSDQGFTISGDYIYAYEGDGKDGYGSNPVPTDGKAVLIINAVNWRTGEYLYRKAILKKTIVDNMCQGDDSGEPESLKIHRDATGRPFMVIGVVTGASGARKYNCFAYKQRRGGGVGRTFEIAPSVIGADAAGLDFGCVMTGEAELECVTEGDVRGIHAAVVGTDGGCFSVEKAGGDVAGGDHRFKVGFTPDAYKRDYSAYLRLSSPGASDVLVPLSGSYLGEIITGTTEINADDDAAAETGEAEYYDLQGRRLAEPKTGLNIVRSPGGSASKLLVK